MRQSGPDGRFWFRYIWRRIRNLKLLGSVGFCWVLSSWPGLSLFLGPISGRQDDNCLCRHDNGHGSELKPWNPVSIQLSERRIQLQIIISRHLHPAARLHSRTLSHLFLSQICGSVCLCDWQTGFLMCWFIIYLLTWQLIFHSVDKNENTPTHTHTWCFINADRVSLKHLLFSSDSVLEADGTLCLYCYILLASC